MRGLRSLAMEGGTVCCLGLALAGSVTGYAYGIELQPSAAQIQATVERGRTAARDRVSPDQLHTWFGAADALAPRGFIMTKLGSLLVMANHLALRDLTPTEQDIAQVMANEQLLVSIVIYGERLNFAADSYVVLEQGGEPSNRPACGSTPEVIVRRSGPNSRPIAPR